MKKTYKTRSGWRFKLKGTYISDTDYVKVNVDPMIRRMVKDGDLIEVDAKKDGK